MKTIVAIDDSPNARACIQFLCRSPVKESDVEVLCIWANGTRALLPSVGLSRDKAEQLVKSATESLSESGYTNVSGHTPEGNVIAEILQAIDKWHPGVTILGAHSRNNLKEVFVGNVANQVLRNANSSVMIVRDSQNSLGKGISRVLVCVDDSDITDNIFNELRNFQWNPGTTLRFLHVLEPDDESVSEDPKTDAELCLQRMGQRRAAIQQRLATEFVAIKRGTQQIELNETIVEDLDAADAILENARIWSAELIVMGSHRRQGMERLLLGSVSEKVSASAACSVYVVR